MLFDDPRRRYGIIARHSMASSLNYVIGDS